MEAKRTVAVLGGSFDPPHVGHVLLASWALACGGVDAVLVVPTFGHAFGKKSAPYEHRVRMVELAFAHLRHVEVSRIEETLPVPSYTVQTLEALAAAMPGTSFRLLCGADVLADLPKWKEPDRLLALAPLLACGRGGHTRTAGGRTVSTLGPDLPAVSSTEIRAALRNRTSVAGLVPTAVARYVAEHRLYDAPS
jgi:nicotinate-nucleotide adenylyltransferase